MRIILTVTAGPHKGRAFSFDRHDTFLVGRSRHAHFQLLSKDRYFSRIHFMCEVNPPECRLIDMGSHNGTYVNGERVLAADLKHGDEIRAGHTVLRMNVERVSSAAAPAETVSYHPPAAGPALPVIPGYVLERELGHGAMGVTYLGRRAADDEPVAVKVVQPSFPGARAQIDEFLSSARVLMQLDHSNIVRLRDVGSSPAGICFVSDLVMGRSAADVLASDGALSIKRALRWADQMLQALHYAHSQGFVHHDLKPTNILVAEINGKEIIKLADFGLARVYQAAPFSGLSLTVALLERASFIPPEVLFSYQEINPLSDQYSAAAIIYHLLTAAPVIELPKAGNRRYSSLLRRQVVPIGERRADVPARLAETLHKALSRPPAQRFADIAAFRRALIQPVQGD